jgi:ATP-dependent DNA helicase RecQ
MKLLKLKSRRIKLAADAYKELRLQILVRDNWRCQSCGSLTNLEVHHMTPRRRAGEDSNENLITLCRSCHKDQHC